MRVEWQFQLRYRHVCNCVLFRFRIGEAETLDIAIGQPVIRIAVLELQFAGPGQVERADRIGRNCLNRPIYILRFVPGAVR